MHTLRVFDGVHTHIEGTALTSIPSCGGVDNQSN